jgi:hypothetical protein
MSGLIPTQLRDFRFVLIRRCEKSPFEKEWSTTANYAFDDPTLRRHLEAGGNYGVLADDDHVIIESDSAKVNAAVDKFLPPTFTVSTPGHAEGRHYYFACHKFGKSQPLIEDNDPKRNVGHITAKGRQVVGPGSIHPNGKKYTILRDLPIASVTAEQIREALSDFIKHDIEEDIHEKEQLKKAGLDFQINILDVVPVANLKKQGDELFGPHPIHGSDTGRNFWVHPGKNVWRCFRCDSGGGPLTWLAVQEGIISCDEAKAGKLKGERFKKVLKIARSRGLIPFTRSSAFLSPARLAELKEEMEEIPAELKGMTLDRLKEIIKKWLYLDEADFEVIDVILATALDRAIPGDPIWTFVIGPPGATKTELIRALSGPDIYTTSSVTAHTLITGLRDESAQDLLPQLDGKVLVIKDFTTTLENEDELGQILADLREAYDGYLEKNYGSGVGKKSYHASFGLTAGVTPVIDAYSIVHGLLGERFIKIRMRTDAKKSTERAMQNVGREDEMRKEIRLAVRALLDEAKKRLKDGIKIEIPKEIERKLLELAVFTATARSGVHRDRQHIMTVLPEAEVGTRLVKQLKKLMIALAVVRGKSEVGLKEFYTILRVATDSVPKKRLKVLEAFLDGSENADGLFLGRQISQVVRAPTTTVTETLEDLWALGLLSRFGDEDKVTGAFKWQLKPETVELMKDSGLFYYLSFTRNQEANTRKINTYENTLEEYNNRAPIPGELRRKLEGPEAEKADSFARCDAVTPASQERPRPAWIPVIPTQDIPEILAPDPDNPSKVIRIGPMKKGERILLPSILAESLRRRGAVNFDLSLDLEDKPACSRCGSPNNLNFLHGSWVCSACLESESGGGPGG